jgi:Ca2+-binding EF-hand superfamily protein
MHKLLSDLNIESGDIKFGHFLKIYMLRKQQGPEGDTTADIMDAYVAMGGDEDGGGNVDADKLIDIIKNEFGLTIDIEGLIKQIDSDGSGEIEFEEFQMLLANDGNNPEIETFGDWFGFEKPNLG